MANNENLDFSYTNLDYTAKDFGSIYPQMLDLAKQLTNKWDPSQSNESDPGVVLIKEGAFVADHNNYNIDKNILENFLPTATQDKSVRNITEMNGYVPRYYVSATGDITFTWTKKDDDTNTDFFSIPAFTLVVSDADETVSYTQIEPLSISGSGVQSSCAFIEGTLQQLVVNDSNVITLENIDDNNRLYLPENMVAQNGIYIKNTNSSDYNDYWERNNYILTQPLGLHIYKIDYDSVKDLPYIEFPSDIANIIGDGLEISYIATSGINGNVSANKLTKIISSTTFETEGDENETITRNVDGFSKISNSYAITNGKNPETIDEMYQSFKRIVGTFDTLVTCKDYENEIYMMEDENNNPLVSNVYVTDRRTDFNKAAQIITYDVDNNFTRFKSISTDKCSLNFMGCVENLNDISSEKVGDMYCVLSDRSNLYVNMTDNDKNYVAVQSINLNDFSILTQAMTPYDLIIYAFKVLALTDANNIATINKDYNKSFSAISNSELKEIENYIEDVKCISHTYKYPNSSDYLVFKNYAPIKIEIETYNKVEHKQVYDSIITNVYAALAENFNPRNIEFGIRLDEDKVKNVIIGADERIKNADVYIIDYLPSAVKYNGNEEKITDKVVSDEPTILIDLIAKNILAGRLCLFDFDNRFDFDYGQFNGHIYRNQDEVKTELVIPLNTDNSLVQSNPQQTIIESSIRYNTEEGNFLYTYVNLDDEGNPRGSIANGSQVNLSVYNEKTNKSCLTIYETDSNGSILSETVYKSEGVAEPQTDDDYHFVNGNTQIWISNNLNDGVALEQQTTKTQLPSGDLIVYKKKVVNTYEYATPNIDYTLNENEAFQIIYPNYYSDKTYSLYVNYRFEKDWNSSEGAISGYAIKAGDEYELKAGERLIFVYNDQGSLKTDILSAGDIVKSSFDILVTDSLTSTSKKEYRASNGSTVTAAFRTITSGQSIERRLLMRTIINNVGPWCYWITNDENNRLFAPDQEVRILKSDEYFIYTNSSVNEIMILGAGTKLERSDIGTAWEIPSSTVSIDSIQREGISLEIPWQKNIDFAKYPFYITEMNVITLGESDSIKIYGWDPALMPRSSIESQTREFNYYGWDNYLENEGDKLVPDGQSLCDGIISYTVNNETIILPKHQNFYYVKSRFDLNTDSGLEQKLITNKIEDSSGELIELISSQRIHLKENSEDKVISSDISQIYIQSSDAVVAIGNNINLLPNTEGDYPDFYVYEKDNEIHQRSLKLTVETDEPAKYPFYAEVKENVQDISSKIYMVPIHVIGNETPSDFEKYKGSYNEISDIDFDPNEGDLVIIGAVGTQQYWYIYTDDNWARLRPVLKIKAWFTINNDGTDLPLYITDYNVTTTDTEELILTGNTSYYLVPKSSSSATISKDSMITLNIQWDGRAVNSNEVILIDDLVVINGVNTELKSLDGEHKNALTRLNEQIQSIIQNSDQPSIKPYYPYQLDSSIAMNKFTRNYDSNSGAGSIAWGDTLWDKNNIINKMTLAQIDLVKMNTDKLVRIKNENVSNSLIGNL